MSFNIDYSTRATIELEKIIGYIIDEFGFSKGQEVRNTFRKTIEQIAKNPNLFPYFDRDKNIRKCVISFQTTLYYKFEIDTVVMLSFRSNWMNPKSRNL